MAEQPLDIVKNTTGKLYLAKKGSTGAGDEIQVIVKEWHVEPGERGVDKINLASSNYALLEKPSELGTFSATFISNVNSFDIVAMALGEEQVSGDITTITGDTERKRYRVIYEYTRDDGSVVRETIEDIIATKPTIDYVSDKEIEIKIDGVFPNDKYKREQTTDPANSPLPAIPDYS